jgi:CHAD domain-containing protein
MKVATDGPRSDPAEAAEPVSQVRARVDRSSPAVGVASLELRRQLVAWSEHEPGARRGSDPEDLHQLRVAARRIDASLRLFSAHLPASILRTRRPARRILRTLGTARDYDVQLVELERYCATLTVTECAAAAPLRTRLEAEREHARARMAYALDSDSVRGWLETLDQESAALAEATVGAALAVTVMPERVHKRFRKLRKAVRGLGRDAAMEEYHEVRRRTKQLRYAIESGAQIYGKPAEEMLKALRRLQDNLGEHQDAYLAKDRLACIAAEPRADLPAETLFFMGRLAEHHLGVTAQARKSLKRGWRKVSGRRWKALHTRMEQLGSAALRASERSSAAPDSTAPGVGPDDAVAQADPATLRH